MRPLHAAAIVTVLIAGLLAAGAFFIQSTRLSDDRVAAPTASSVRAAATNPAETKADATPTVPPSTAAATARAAAARQTATVSVVIEKPAATLVPREGVVLSIPILSVDGTEQPILPGTPTPTPAWWQRVEGPVPDSLSKPLLEGYLRFWDRRGQALSTLDSSGLTEVLDGPPLAAEVAAIERLRSSGQIQRVDVDHSITLLWATSEEGAVHDTLLNRSVTASAGEPSDAVPTPTPEAYRMAYRLTLLNGVWKVTDAMRLAL